MKYEDCNCVLERSNVAREFRFYMRLLVGNSMLSKS